MVKSPARRQRALCGQDRIEGVTGGRRESEAGSDLVFKPSAVLLKTPGRSPMLSIVTTETMHGAQKLGELPEITGLNQVRLGGHRRKT